MERARLRLAAEMPGLALSFHAAAEWETDKAALRAWAYRPKCALAS
jgi:magnesium chelatase subunit H